jgi:hypothetical protein
MASNDGERAVTLREFVEDNHKLVSALGILVALCAFSSRLRPANLGLTLASVFLAMAVLILLELWAAFPRGRAAKRLQWFGLCLLATMFLVAAYWLMAFREIWPGVLVLPIWAALTGAFTAIISAIISRPRIIGLMSRFVRNRGGTGEAVGILRPWWLTALAIAVVFALLHVSVQLERVVGPLLYNGLTRLFGAP